MFYFVVMLTWSPVTGVCAVCTHMVLTVNMIYESPYRCFHILHKLSTSLKLCNVIYALLFQREVFVDVIIHDSEVLVVVHSGALEI